MTDFEQPDQINDEFVSRLRQIAKPTPCNNVEQTFYAAGWAAAATKYESMTPSPSPIAATKPWRLFSAGAFSGFAAACLLWIVQINMTPNTPDQLAANPSPHASTEASDIDATAQENRESLPLDTTVAAIPQNSTEPINTTKEKLPQRQTHLSPWQQLLFGSPDEWTPPVASRPGEPKPAKLSLLRQVADTRELLDLLDRQNPSRQYFSTSFSNSTAPQTQPTLRFGPIKSEFIDQLFE
jgi:hypothetical protein